MSIKQSWYLAEKLRWQAEATPGHPNAIVEVDAGVNASDKIHTVVARRRSDA